MFLSRNIFHTIKAFLLISLLVFSGSCDEPLNPNWKFPYKIGNPEVEYKIPKDLAEISGLDLISDDQAVLVEDETGSLFYYDFKSGMVTGDQPFAENGDYEDVQVINNLVYVLRADGTI